MIYLICKGEIIMYHELSEKEIDKFIRKYLYPYEDFKKKINTMSCISYNNVYEYLINKQYILKIYT